MKKHLVILLMLFTTLNGMAAGNGGFKAEGEAPAPQDQKSGYRGITDGQRQTMTSDLAKLPDRSWVSLKGNIVKKTSGKGYLLRDEKGTIPITISDVAWQGQEVKPDDLVSLNGQLNRSKGRVVVSVHQLRRL